MRLRRAVVGRARDAGHPGRPLLLPRQGAAAAAGAARPGRARHGPRAPGARGPVRAPRGHRRPGRGARLLRLRRHRLHLRRCGIKFRNPTCHHNYMDIGSNFFFAPHAPIDRLGVNYGCVGHIGVDSICSGVYGLRMESTEPPPCMPGGQETFKEYGAPFGSGDEIGVFVDLASSPGAAAGCTRFSLPSSGCNMIMCGGSCAYFEGNRMWWLMRTC